MKLFLAISLLAFSSLSFASYTPQTEVSIGSDKTIYISVINDSINDLNCKYSVSWFVNTLQLKKSYGEAFIPAGNTASFSYKNDINDHLGRINLKAICD